MTSLNKHDQTMDAADELPAGTQLMSGQYEITGYLNHGGFGITYLAKDSLDRVVVVKECFPSSMCRRNNLSVQARSRSHVKDLESVVRLFIKEAQALSKLEHPNIVGVHQVFEDHDTAYMVLDFVDGSDLLTYIEQPADKLMPAQIKSVLEKVLDAIGFVHDAGVLHRDISPDNIILTKSFEPMLIDFGAARRQATKTTQALSALRVVKDGYSPQEFYLAGSTQAPASDLYSLAATFYHLITGQVPPDSQMRLTAHVTDDGDPYVPLAQKTSAYDESFCAAIDKALAILPRDRIQTAAEWKTMMVEKPKAKVKSKKAISRIPSRRLSRQTKLLTARPKPKKKTPTTKSNMPAFAITLAAASVLLGGIFFAPTEQTSAVVQAAADETPTVLAPAVPEQEVASVVVEAPTLQVEEVVDVTALAPDVIVAEAASTTSSLSDMPTSWADGQVTLGWTADVPFILDENIAITSTDVSQLPVPIGSRLTSVNGQDVADLSAVDAAINDAVTASDGTLVQMTLGWTAPDGDSTFSTELPVDVIYKTSFKSGVHFETSFVEDKWITRVTETPEIEGYALQLGDEIVALVPENERIVGATSLAEVTHLAASKNRTELQFAIRRDNTLWIADIMLTQEAG